MSYCAIGSLASCLSASKQGLPIGGYGANGVCIDSVAIVQMALGEYKSGGTNFYPILLFGAGRQELFEVTQALLDIAASNAAGHVLHGDVQCVMDAIKHLPNDIAPTISAIPDVCDRIMQNIPPNCPFSLLKQTRSACCQVLEKYSQGGTVL